LITAKAASEPRPDASGPAVGRFAEEDWGKCQPWLELQMGYPLANIQKAIENGH